MDSGPKTREYRTLERNLSRIIDCLSATVDPSTLALKLHENDLVTRSTVDSANIIHGMTPVQRILPVLTAILAQVELVASKYHNFVTILKHFNPVLADVLCEYFSTNLALNVVSAVEEVLDWETLGHQLDVDPVKLCELQNSDRNPKDCKEELLIFWVKHDRSASWEKLVRALDRMEEQDIAQKIREKYSCTQGEEDLEAAVNDDCEVAKRIENFEERFSSLEFATLIELEEKQTSLKRFRHSITLLPVAIKRDHKKFLEESLSDITKVESLDELFMHLNLYWNFLDYSLLEHVINRFGSITLKQQMKIYASDLSQFRKSTTVRQFVSNCPGNCCRRVEPLPPHFSKIKCKLDRKASEYTLEELEQTRKKFCREFSLSEFVVTLGDVEDGSVTVWWIVPSVIVPELTTAVRNHATTFVEDCRVLVLAIDGQCVFDRQKSVMTKVHSPQRLLQKINGEESTNDSAVAIDSDVEEEVVIGESVLDLKEQIESMLHVASDTQESPLSPSLHEEYEWVINVRTLTGKTIPIRCNRSDRIVDIKAKISRKEGVTEENQKLLRQSVAQVYNPETETLDAVTQTIELQNDDKLLDCEVQNGQVLLLRYAVLYTKSLSGDDSGDVTVKSTSGKVFTVPVKASDPVKVFKSTLQQTTGVPSEMQTILFAGMKLRDHLTLRDYHIHDGSIVHLVPMRVLDQKIYVNTLEGKTFALQYKACMVQELKSMIHLKTGIAPNCQYLIFAGNRLKDNQALDTCNIKAGDTIRLVVGSPTLPDRLAIKSEESCFLSEMSQGSIVIQVAHLQPLLLDVRGSDTVNNVKAKIHQLEPQISPEKQRLVFAGNELDNSKTLCSYGIRNGDSLHLLFVPQLKVWTSTGETVHVKDGSSDLVSAVKTQLYKQVGVNPECQCLLFAGQEMEDYRTIGSYNILGQIDPTIHLAVRPALIYVRSLTEETISVDYNPSDTIASVKGKIQSKLGLPSNQQILIFRYQVLEDDRKISSYHIQSRSTIYVLGGAEQTPKFLFIKVDSLNRTVILEYDPNMSIAEVKSKIQEEERIPVSQQTLLCEKHRLKDSDTLISCGVPIEGTLDLLIEVPEYISEEGI